MSKIEVDAITEQSGTTLTTGGGAGKTVVVDATTVTLGRCGGTVALASGASQTGFGRTGTVDWITTPKTATFTAVSGEGYFCNTSGGAFTVNLPAGVAGAIVSLADYAATWQTNNLTVSPNGTEKIGSINANVALNTQGQSVTLVYVDSTQGWINTMDSTSNVRGNAFVEATGGTITTCGNFKIHTFTGPGNFTVSSAGTPVGSETVDYLVIAGGGGGGGCMGGGGGAGGYRESSGTASGSYTVSPLGSGVSALPVSVQGYTVTVGGSGAGGGPGSKGSDGSVSTFSTITSAGGGAGGSAGPSSGPTSGNTASNGGSGGGQRAGYNPGFGPIGGTGNTPPVSPPQGNNGGKGFDGLAATTNGGGGGGAGAVGSNAVPTPSPNGGPGGNGVATSITGSSVTRVGGGGGGSDSGGDGSGGSGGGGGSSAPTGNAGTVNTGSGGGGGSAPNNSGGAGGSGIVIIRYKFQ